MIIRTIHESNPVARKVYTCDACLFVMDALGCVPFEIADMRKIVLARRDDWQIKPGVRYIRQFNTDGAEQWTFRAIPAMHEICLEYELYPDWR